MRRDARDRRTRARPLPRLGHLLAGRNPLRRVSDRIEAALLVALVAVFAAAVVASGIAAARVYGAERASAVITRPAVAVLAASGPAGGSMTGGGVVRARSRSPGGSTRTGLLTTLTAPAIYGASVGAVVPIWLTKAGNLAAPPLSPAFGA